MGTFSVKHSENRRIV